MQISTRPLTGQLMASSETLDVLYPLGLIGLPSSWNHGQCCCAGTRIFVQSGVYDEFLAKFTEKVKAIKVGDPFAKGIDQGPQVSKVRFDVRSPPLPFSTTKIIVRNLARVSCRTSSRARRMVPKSTLVVSVTEVRVTSSKYVHPFASHVTSELIRPSDPFSPRFSQKPHRK